MTRKERYMLKKEEEEEKEEDIKLKPSRKER